MFKGFTFNKTASTLSNGVKRFAHLRKSPGNTLEFPTKRGYLANLQIDNEGLPSRIELQSKRGKFISDSDMQSFVQTNGSTITVYKNGDIEVIRPQGEVLTYSANTNECILEHPRKGVMKLKKDTFNEQTKHDRELFEQAKELTRKELKNSDMAEFDDDLLDSFSQSLKKGGNLNYLNWFINGMQTAAMAEAPHIMTAAGQYQDTDGNWQYDPNRPGAQDLRDDLQTIGEFGVSILGGEALQAAAKAANAAWLNPLSKTRKVKLPLKWSSLGNKVINGVSQAGDAVDFITVPFIQNK